MFGKSEFRDEKGEIDLSKIEKKIEESFFLAQKYNIKCAHYVKNILCSEAVRVIEHYKTGERAVKYDTELIHELSIKSKPWSIIKRLFVEREECDKDKSSYVVEIRPRNSVIHH
ncbi:MAG: hypothetical protein WC584_04675 [Candidatus Pacearchaeota archaeon]